MMVEPNRAWVNPRPLTLAERSLGFECELPRGPLRIRQWVWEVDFSRQPTYLDILIRYRDRANTEEDWFAYSRAVANYLRGVQ